MEIKGTYISAEDFKKMFEEAKRFDSDGCGKIDCGGKKYLFVEGIVKNGEEDVKGVFCFVQSKVGSSAKLVTGINVGPEVYELQTRDNRGKALPPKIIKDLNVALAVKLCLEEHKEALDVALDKFVPKITVTPRDEMVGESQGVAAALEADATDPVAAPVVDPVDPAAPVAPVVLSNVGEYYDLELPSDIKGNKDTIPARVVFSKHPQKSGEGSLYIIKDPRGFDHHDIEEYKDPAKLLSKYNAAVVHRVKMNKNGDVKISHYNTTPITVDGQQVFKVLKNDIVAKDKKKGIEDWVNGLEAYKDRDKADRKASRSFVKKNVVLSLVTGAVALILTAGVIAGFGPGRTNKSEEAIEFGKNNAKTRIEEVVEKDSFFVYQSGKPVTTGKMFDRIFEDELPVMKQNEFWGWARKYPMESFKGFGQNVGYYVAQEMLDKGIDLSTIDANGQIVTQFYYPEEVASSNWGTDEAIAQLQNEQSFIDYLTERGYSQEDATNILQGYKDGFLAKVKEFEMGAAIGGEIVDPQPETPVDEQIELNVDDLVVKSAVSTAASDVANKIVSAENVNVFYVSLEEGKVFANTSDAIYDITLADGEIASNSDFAQLIAKGNATEAVKASVLFRNIEGAQELIEAKKAELGAQEIYVANARYSNGWSVTPTLIYVKDDGATVVVEEMRTVSVRAGKEAAASAAEMAAYSVFGVDTTGKYKMPATSTATATTYSDNDLTEETPAPVASVSDERTLG